MIVDHGAAVCTPTEDAKFFTQKNFAPSVGVHRGDDPIPHRQLTRRGPNVVMIERVCSVQSARAARVGRTTAIATNSRPRGGRTTREDDRTTAAENRAGVRPSPSASLRGEIGRTPQHAELSSCAALGRGREDLHDVLVKEEQEVLTRRSGRTFTDRRRKGCGHQRLATISY